MCPGARNREISRTFSRSMVFDFREVQNRVANYFREVQNALKKVWTVRALRACTMGEHPLRHGGSRWRRQWCDLNSDGLWHNARKELAQHCRVPPYITARMAGTGCLADTGARGYPPKYIPSTTTRRRGCSDPDRYPRVVAAVLILVNPHYAAPNR